MRNKFNIENKSAQVTIFIIIAILIAGSILGYFLLKDRLQIGMPKEILPVYNYFLSCVEDETKMAASIIGSQGGYLELPEFEPGSQYMPFSSQLDFLGSGVPYWYYVSGNGIAKEQIPSKEKMQEQLKSYLTERISQCSFKEFQAKGFVIEKDNPEVSLEIKDNEIDVNVNMPLVISFGDTVSRQTSHKVVVSSNLGKFYNLAKKIYDKEKSEMFLENYGVDVLRLYAPVDGSDIGCSPKIWNLADVRKNLTSALEANTPAIKIKGDYYSLANKDNKYFVQNIGESIGGSGESVNFLYLKNWPTKMEVWPSESGMLIAEPMGLQEGMGALGFCYVPYHFVYDLAYPVLIQIYDSQEMFQVPIAIVIDKNKPRKALDVQGLPDVVPELCQHKISEMNVYTYNTRLEPVEAQISFKCFDTSCEIGATKITGSGDEALLTSKFPQCANGYIIAAAEGYETKKYLFSTVQSNSAEIILDKKYKLSLEVQKNSASLKDEYAIVNFIKNNKTTTAVYPDSSEIELTEGQYKVKVYIYSNSTLNVEGSSAKKCVEVPKSGIFGVFGATEEKCFDLNIPEQIISSAVSGGGTQEYYVTESELEEGKLLINSADFGTPKSIEGLQNNYNNIEINGLDITFG